MENLRLGVSAVRHDMKQEETVEEVEKNTELERQTPKPEAPGSNPGGDTTLNAEDRKIFRVFANKIRGSLTIF